MTDKSRTSLAPWVPTCFAILPLAIAALIHIVSLSRRTFRAPKCLRPLVQEPIDQDDDDADDDEHADDKSLGNWSYSTICLGCLSVAGFVVQLCMAVRLPWAIMPTVAWALAVVHVMVQRPRTAPVLMVFFFLSMLAAQLVILAAMRHGNIPLPISIMGSMTAIIAVLATAVGVNMPLRDPSVPSENISKPFTAPTSELRSPEDNMTLWQWMSVSWMAPMISLGARRQLDDDDVWLLGYDFQTKHLHDGFRELQGSVVVRLIRANCIDLGILGALAVLELIANYSQPLLLQRLLLALEITNLTVQPAVTFGMLTLAASLVATQTSIFTLWFGRRAYERSRGTLIMMLYEKSLARKIMGGVGMETELDDLTEGIVPNSTGVVERVATGNEVDVTEFTPLLTGNGKNPSDVRVASRNPIERVKSTLANFFTKKKPVEEKKMPASMGKIINMFRNDAYDIAQRIWEADQLITKPMSLILALALSWRIIGWSIMFGVGVVVVAQLSNILLARLMISWEKTRRKVTDDRLQKTSQFIEAIRHLRWYGWQCTWLVGIMESRQRELNIRVITSLLKMGINITSIIASGMLPVVTFYAYTELAGKQLRVDIAFPALALFDMLQRELRDLPQLVTAWLNAMVAVRRLEEFMAEPDRTEEKDISVNYGDSLELIKATFAWPGSTRSALQSVNLRLVPGLNVVFGEVGAGKTALLQGLLGELNLISGALVKPDKAIGYCAQTPWLQSMSIRDNILFSAPYDQTRYKDTIAACALAQDFSGFKDGDLSEIGENGIGLSGGQKARVALARAVYSRTEILLLDDPLSALDQQTAEWVAKRCLNGELMTGRTVVLVTHRTDLCQGIAKQMIEISQRTAHISDEELAVLATVNSREARQGGVDARQAEKEQESTSVPDKFLSEEHRASGGIRWTVYWQFIKAGGAWTWIALLIVDVIFHALLFVRNWFLKEWGEAYKGPQELSFWLIQKASSMNPIAQAASTPLSRFFDRLPDPAVNPSPWLIGLLVIVLIQSAAWLGDQCVMVVLIYTTGRKMFRLIMDRVTNAIFHFYDITPVGRLMNRMTSDIGAIDGRISATLSNVIFWGASWVITVFVIASTTPAFLVAAALLTTAFVLIFLRFLPTSQSLRRLETVSLSPLMSNFGALLEGLTTVRAFCAQPRFRNGAITSVDKFQKMDHFYWSTQAWLQYRFDILSAVSTFAMTLLAIFTGVSPGLTAFVLRAAGRLVQNTHAMCKEYGQLQMDFVSVERVVELFHIEQEPKGTLNPPAWWPSSSSDVVFEDVVIRYAPHLEPALSGISFTLPGGSNTAVIGRTGSGKSTLALALLGTILPESGRILIGGIDIAEVDKQALRSRVSFLAQDPVLFPGSMRQNLDPTNQHSDGECVAVLQRVCGRFGWTLQTEIDAGGKNLSQGQRQLIGLCRAILRRSALIIMDEATASIDKETAWEIQRVVREVLTDSTVITIAHRSEAVRGADYCLNLGKGKVIGFGRPEELSGGGNGNGRDP